MHTNGNGKELVMLPWLRSPHWRWTAAMDAVARRPPSVALPPTSQELAEAGGDDLALRGAAFFHEWASRGPAAYGRALDKFPDVARAYMLFVDRGRLAEWRTQVESLALTGADPREIEEATQLPGMAGLVETYCRLFFDIGQYRGAEIAIRSNVLVASGRCSAAGDQGAGDGHLRRWFAFRWGLQSYMDMFVRKADGRSLAAYNEWMRDEAIRMVTQAAVLQAATMVDGFREEAERTLRLAKEMWSLPEEVADAATKQMFDRQISLIHDAMRQALTSSLAATRIGLEGGDDFDEEADDEPKF